MGSRDHSYECYQCGHERGGLNDVLCDCDMLGLTDKIEAMEALSNLASCLRWAGALCAAFDSGWDQGMESEYVADMLDGGWMNRDEVAEQRAKIWTPGCGKSTT